MGGSVGTNGFLSSVDPMLDINLRSAVCASHLAARFLTQDGSGLLALTGAAAAGAHALAPTPGMLAYGMSKAATHQLVVSLAHPDSGLKNATVVCLLPSVAD